MNKCLDWRIIMNNEEKNTITAEETNVPLNGNEVDYISEIQKLKANTVSLDDYNRLKADNKKLINALATGEGLGSTEPTKPTPEYIQSLRNKLFNRDGGLGNAEFFQAAVELRNALIANGEPDFFLTKGQVVTINDIDDANALGDALTECFQYSKGDSDVATAELMRRTVETPIPRRK